MICIIISNFHLLCNLINAVLYTLKYKKVHKNLISKAHSVTGATLNARDFQALHLKAENQRAEECKIKQHKELQVH